MTVRFDRVQREESVVNVCVHVQMCVKPYTHVNGHVWVNPVDVICYQPARAHFVPPDTRLCLKHFQIRAGWQRIQGDSEVTLHIATPPLATIITSNHVQTLQRSSNINSMEKVVRTNYGGRRQKPGEPSLTAKKMVCMRFMKGHRKRGRGSGDRDRWTSEATAPCYREGWVEQEAFAVLHWSLQTLKSQS